MSVESVKQAFRDRALEFAGLNATVKFDMGDDGCIVVDARQTPPTVADEDADADVTIRMSADNLEKLAAGALNPTLAYAMGKLKIDGSMGLAMKVAALLDD